MKLSIRRLAGQTRCEAARGKFEWWVWSALSIVCLAGWPVAQGAVQITSFSPASGVYRAEVEIRGADLLTVQNVSFNGVPARFAFTPTLDALIAFVPLQATTGPITLTSPQGSHSSATPFVVTQATSLIDYFTPSGSAGASVVIALAESAGVKSVSFNGVEAKFVPFSLALQPGLVATVPAGTATGPITLVTDLGTYSTAAPFTVSNDPVAAPPFINRLLPAEGPVGSRVYIEGLNLRQGAVGVLFGDRPAEFSLAGNGLVAIVPDRADNGPITVITLTGTTTSSVPFAITSASPALQPPILFGFSPSRGNSETGSAVAIDGLRFAETTSVQFNGLEAQSFKVDGDSVIYAVPPAEVTTGPITVVTRRGIATTAANFVAGAPEVAVQAIRPMHGPPGSTVVISLSVPVGVATVEFNGVKAAFVPLGVGSQAEALAAVVPDGAATGKLTVTTSLGQAESRDAFTIIPAPWRNRPLITSVTPEAAAPGRTVLIRGTGLVGIISAVQFNGTPAEFVPVNQGIKAIVPAGATTGPISVFSTFAGVTSPRPFTVTAADPVPPQPEITAFVPETGTVGSPIDIEGVNLTDALSVRFNGLEASFYPGWLPDTLVATVPDEAVTGPITVVTKVGTATTVRPFVVGGPRLFSYFPNTGLVGDQVTLRGVNFSNVTEVTIGGQAASYRIMSNNELVATIPPEAVSGRVELQSPVGRAFVRTNDFLLLPTVEKIDPPAGFEQVKVSVTGTGFQDVTDVAFGGIPTEFELKQANLLSVTVPRGLTSGPVTVTTRGGSATSQDTYTVKASLDIELFMRANRSPATVGEEIVFSLVLTNHGSLNATGVVITDTIPLSMEFVSASFPQGKWRTEGNQVIFEVGDLRVGESVTATVIGKVKPAPGVIHTALASMTKLPEAPDRNNENNFAASIIIANYRPPLTVRFLNADQIEITWPFRATGYFLQVKDDSEWPGSWANLPAQVIPPDFGGPTGPTPTV